MCRYKNLVKLIIALLPLGCGTDETATPSALQPTAINRYVVQSLKDVLDVNGVFAPPASNWLAPNGMVTAAQAKELALAYARTFGAYVKPDLERSHSKSIKLAALRAAPRVLFVESAYRPLPSETFMPLQKAAGPYYLITLLEDGQPAVAVAVSALATDVTIREGAIVFPRYYGNEFRINGINALTGNGAMISPEFAVESAARSTGALVSNVPRLFSRGVYWWPQLGYWDVELDRDIPVRNSPGLTTRHVFVIHDGSVEFVRPNADQNPLLRVPEVTSDGLDWSHGHDVQLQHR